MYIPLSNLRGSKVQVVNWLVQIQSLCAQKFAYYNYSKFLLLAAAQTEWEARVFQVITLLLHKYNCKGHSFSLILFIA